MLKMPCTAIHVWPQGFRVEKKAKEPFRAMHGELSLFVRARVEELLMAVCHLL